VTTYFLWFVEHKQGERKDSGICHPSFEVQGWDGKTFQWGERRFIGESVPTIFNMPLPSIIGKRITHMWEMATPSQACSDPDDASELFRDPSALNRRFYSMVTEEVPGADNFIISGSCVSKVFYDPYNATPRFMKEMEDVRQTSVRGRRITWCVTPTVPNAPRSMGKPPRPLRQGLSPVLGFEPKVVLHSQSSTYVINRLNQRDEDEKGEEHREQPGVVSQLSEVHAMAEHAGHVQLAERLARDLPAYALAQVLHGHLLVQVLRPDVDLQNAGL